MNPNVGLFIQHPNNVLYFNPNVLATGPLLCCACSSQEFVKIIDRKGIAPIEYELLGYLVGLAVYNNVLLELNFPKVENLHIAVLQRLEVVNFFARSCCTSC